MTIDPSALDTLFRSARTANAMLQEPVSDAQLHALHDLMQWGPTSMNCQPTRILFLRSEESRAKLATMVMPGNVPKVTGAPVVAILGYDVNFWEQLPELFPHMPTAKDWFAGNPAFAEVTALRNGSLQGGYFILAARAVGLDCGPMSGFDNAKVDAAFFAGTTVKSNFICALGHGDPARVFPRLPRVPFEKACKLL